MAFNSISFFIFFILFVFGFYLIRPVKYNYLYSLTASYIFYSFIDLRSLIILFISTVVDYFFGILLGSKLENARRKKLLFLGIAINICTILYYKYSGLLMDTYFSIVSLLVGKDMIPASVEILAPVGISFFCFKKISYLVDVYRQDILPEKHFGYFALYVSHFLEIMSGPIDRAHNLIPQFKKKTVISLLDLRKGALLVLWGLLLKVVIADRLVLYTDAVFSNIVHHNGPSLLVAAYFYSFQIYCDFAGYTNIALGCGKILGYDLAPNFNFPYFSLSISEFWRRWHMSLSFWFRDYIYIPLGGNRVSFFRHYINILIVFLICGIWHGAKWTFLVWGGLHGLYIVVGLITQNYRNYLYGLLGLPFFLKKGVRIFISFHILTFAWILFRANSLSDFYNYIDGLQKNWPDLFIDSNSMVYGFMGIFTLIAVEVLKYNKMLTFNKFTRFPQTVQWSCYYLLMFTIILFGVESDSAFIYFQF